jgi:transcriptional regulator with XRE-family HTH domain
MLDRISLILRSKNISASQFADKIGVQRSSVSHVLSGRNKPSLEFVQKVLLSYPDISTGWLLFGHGPMMAEKENEKPKEKSTHKETGHRNNEIDPDLFFSDIKDSEKDRESVKTVTKDLKKGDIESVLDPGLDKQQRTGKRKPQMSVTDPDRIEPRLDHKRIEKIIILYNDQSFRLYEPENL